MKILKKNLGVVVGVTYLGMVGINALANSLPINGVNTGQVSDAYKNLFAPAGITFSIWGLIYLLLGVFTIYQLGWLKKNKEVKKKLVREIGFDFAITSVANSLWVIAWHYNQIGISVLLMLVILGYLMRINTSISRESLSREEKWLIRVPFSVYFGWITVATIANVTTWLVSVGWDGAGITPEVWTMIMVGVGTGIGITRMFKDKSTAYGWVFVWALGGIWYKHTAAWGFNGQYPGVVLVVISCIGLWLMANSYVLVKKKQDLSLGFMNKA